MKRILFLATTFLVIMLLSRPDDLQRPNTDTVSLKQSAGQKIKFHKPIVKNTQPIISNERIEEYASDETIEEEEEELSESSNKRQRAPSSEISEESWNEELFQFLQVVDPRSGDQLFDQYQAEKAAYKAEVELLLTDREKFKNEEIVQDIDESMDQVHERFQGRLQEIFGQHYESYKTFEREFQIKPSQD